MCDPVTAGIGLLAGAGATSAMSSYKTGKYNQNIAEQNEELANQDATLALARGTQKENQARRQLEQVKGRQVVANAANNIEMSGSAMDILTDTALVGELDVMTIRNEARREAFGYKVQGKQYQAQGRLDNFKGKTGAVSSVLKTGGTILGQV